VLSEQLRHSARLRPHLAQTGQILTSFAPTQYGLQSPTLPEASLRISRSTDPIQTVYDLHEVATKQLVACGWGCWTVLAACTRGHFGQIFANSSIIVTVPLHNCSQRTSVIEWKADLAPSLVPSMHINILFSADTNLSPPENQNTKTNTETDKRTTSMTIVQGRPWLPCPALLAVVRWT